MRTQTELLKLAAEVDRVAAKAKEFSAVVDKVDAKTVTLSGDGNALLKAGITVPKGQVPGNPKVGDDYFAEWTPGPKGGTWVFTEMKF